MVNTQVALSISQMSRDTPALAIWLKDKVHESHKKQIENKILVITRN